MSTTDVQPEPLTKKTVMHGPGTAPVEAHELRVADRNMSVAYRYVSRAKLMIVDDEPVNIKAVEKHLRGIGYENFVTTTKAAEAAAMIPQEQPDLILLDIMMPEINGLDLLCTIRKDVRWQHLPVIILTADGSRTTKRKALKAGATDFLAKPVDPHELALRVRNVLVAKVFYDHIAQRADDLEGTIRRQTEELVAARHEAELRYVAGKAEIAANVLHNVGNALHSVNAGVDLVSHTVRESKLQSLKRASDLLRQHQDKLSRFLTKDKRGKVLPSYLIELTDALLSERDKIVSELEMLNKHLEHINTVVATQQKYAALCNVTEEVQLLDLLSDVEELMGASLARHGVELVRDYQETSPVNTDRQKLLQVLLNVVKNAIDSTRQAQKPGMRRLEFRFGSRDHDSAFIEVSDNGVGIPQDNLIKVFEHGFTTKKEGHGFGLHSCANIMKELGGSIRAHSQGTGHGATFVLELPFANEGK